MLSICTTICMFCLVKSIDSSHSIALYEIRTRCSDFTNKKTVIDSSVDILKDSLQI